MVFPPVSGGASSRRRMTSLYSGEAEGIRRGSVGGMSTLAVETELGRFQMRLKRSPLGPRNRAEMACEWLFQGGFQRSW